MSNATIAEHTVRWVAVYPDGSTTPRQSWMQDSAFGWDAICSCGWKSRTGGAIASCVRRSIADHKDYGWIDALTPAEIMTLCNDLRRDLSVMRKRVTA